MKRTLAILFLLAAATASAQLPSERVTWGMRRDSVRLRLGVPGDEYTTDLYGLRARVTLDYGDDDRLDTIRIDVTRFDAPRSRELARLAIRDRDALADSLYPRWWGHSYSLSYRDDGSCAGYDGDDTTALATGCVVIGQVMSDGAPKIDAGRTTMLIGRIDGASGVIRSTILLSAYRRYTSDAIADEPAPAALDLR